jgi:hypothetical protein
VRTSPIYRADRRAPARVGCAVVVPLADGFVVGVLVRGAPRDERPRVGSRTLSKRRSRTRAASSIATAPALIMRLCMVRRQRFGSAPSCIASARASTPCASRVSSRIGVKAFGRHGIA